MIIAVVGGTSTSTSAHHFSSARDSIGRLGLVPASKQDSASSSVTISDRRCRHYQVVYLSEESKEENYEMMTRSLVESPAKRRVEGS